MSKIKFWWQGNGALVLLIAFVGWTFAIIVWGVRLDHRVTVIEARGSPQVNELVLQLAHLDEKISALNESLKRHEENSRTRFSPP